MGGIALAQDINLEASVNRNSVRLGESIELTISVSGPVRSIDKPLLPDLSEFDMYTSGTSSNLSIVPGSISYETDYTYVLMPKRIGTFTIKPATVEYKGKVYTSKPIKVTVGKPGGQQQRNTPTQQSPRSRQKTAQNASGDDFFIEQVVDRSNPYLGQQVTLIFRFYQAKNVYDHSLQWPAFNNFWVEDLPPQKVYNEQINGRMYRVTEIRRAIFPMVTGKLKIDPTTMTIPPQGMVDPFNFFNRRTRRSTSQQILKTKSITLNVRELPESKKPSSFTGAVGTYNFRVSLDKDTAEVDQPITLKAVVSGTGNIKKLPAVEIPEIENFRLYDSGSNENISKDGYKVSGSKSYEWVLIPTAPGNYMLPELRFSYFDPWSKQYKTTIKTPGQIHVKASSISSMNPGDRSVNIIPAAQRSLNYIMPKLTNNKYGKALYQMVWVWILQILPIAWLIGLAVYVNHRKRLEGDSAYARRIMATKAARKALTQARASFDTPEKFYGSIYNGIVGFISDKLNISASGMTNRQIIELLNKTGKTGDIVADFDEFLKICDAGRFSPLKPEQSEMIRIYDKAEQLLSALDRGLK